MAAHRDDWLRPSALAHVLVAIALTVAVITFVVLFVAGGWN
jgi:hypothetical protein